LDGEDGDQDQSRNGGDGQLSQASGQRHDRAGHAQHRLHDSS